MVFLIVAASGLVAAGGAMLSQVWNPVDNAAADNPAAVPLVIESVTPAAGGTALIDANGLGFTLRLQLEGNSSYRGAFNVANPIGNDIVIELTAQLPEGAAIDFIDPVHRVSGQAGSQRWRLYLRKDSISIINYRVQTTAIAPSSDRIRVSLNSQEFSVLKFTPMPARAMRMQGGGRPPPPPQSPWPMFRGTYEPQYWQLSGPGTLSVTPSSGPTSNLSFNYDYRNYAPNYIWYTWNFTNTAVATETYDFDWHYSYMHCWFQAKARLYVFADGPSGHTQYTLYDGSGSGTTNMTGSGSIQVNQGYTWGFIVQGYNYDSSQILKGTVTITSTSRER